jgi:hypothetical protein
MTKMKESEYISAQLAGSDVEKIENNLLKSAIELVKASGYDVTKIGTVPHKPMMESVKEHTTAAKDTVVDASKGVGSFFKGLGKITLEKATVAKDAVKDSVHSVVEKGKE